jgi:hypothetical protein
MARTVVTPEQIQFTKENYLKMSASDIDKKFNTSKGVTRRIIKKEGLHVPTELINKLRGEKNSKPFSKEEDDIIRNNILNISYKAISKLLGRGESGTHQRCHQLGFGELMKQKSINSRFNKGHEPLNKGKRMTEEMKEKIKHTFFQKGHLPHNTKDDGSISVRNDKRGIPYMHYRVSLSKWIPLHHKVWIDENGEIPKGHNVIFKNKNTLDVRLENLECISNTENMLRNTIQRYPDDLKLQLKKISKLKRIIKNKSNE